METNHLSEARLAWLLCQLLERVSNLLWNRYENDFIAFDLDDELLPPEF